MTGDAHNMPKNKTWFGGLILCALPTMIFLLPHRPMPPWAMALLWLFMVYGLWMILTSVFKVRAKVTWFFLGVTLAGFGIVALLVAWDPGRFSGGIWFIPDAWNQGLARVCFTIGGLIFMAISFAFFREAFKVKSDAKGKDDLV
jgi:hypothetical protein